MTADATSSSPPSTPPPTPSPSFTFCLVAAAPFAFLWVCFLPLYPLLWWLPVSITAGYMPGSIPIVSLLHLYATYSAIDDAEWQSWWSISLGTLLLSKAMGMAHESIWDGFEPLVVGREGHGAGVQQAVRSRKASMLDKDGKPLDPQSVLVPSTQPIAIPGEPTFPS